ncbi:hypothetical protein BC828DRAFT_373585 [Blastocladiella britannica]|nr:hypothetical protein BC828DRAFT_373585 [Blastocladiella britannica]
MNGYRMVRSNLEVKFPNRPGVRVALSPLVIHPVMEAHHHAHHAVHSLLKDAALAPRTLHSSRHLVGELADTLANALDHLRAGHRTPGILRAHPGALSADAQLVVSTALAGDALLLCLSHAIPTQAAAAAGAGSLMVPMGGGGGNGGGGPGSGAGSPSRGFGHAAAVSAAAGAPVPSASANAIPSLPSVASLSVPAAVYNPSGLADHARSLSAGPIIGARITVGGHGGGPRHAVHGSATPPPPQAAPTIGVITPSASATLSPLSTAKMRASSSIRSALGNVGVHVGGSDIPSNGGGAGGPKSRTGPILDRPGSGVGSYLWVHDKWSEVFAEAVLEIGWRQLVEFRDKLATAHALVHHISMQLNAFTAIELD